MIHINKGYPLFLFGMKVYITRHSRTKWNEEKRLQGREDSPLTEDGIKNIYALKDYIKDLHVDRIYSSPIKRALTTAQMLFPDREIEVDDRIQEMCFGIYEGIHFNEMPEDMKHDYDILWNHPECSPGLPEGESYEDIESRLHSFIDDIKKKDEDIFIVTHGFCFTVLVSLLLGYERKDYVKINKQIVNGCSLTVFDYDGTFHLEEYGKNDFLPVVSKEAFIKR